MEEVKAQLNELYELFKNVFKQSNEPTVVTKEFKKNRYSSPQITTITYPPKPNTAALKGMLLVTQLREAINNDDDLPPVTDLLATLTLVADQIKEEK